MSVTDTAGKFAESWGRPMRLLWVDLRTEHINPTAEFMYPLLKRVGEVTPFGPGYVDSAILREGLACFERKHGPFDVALASEMVGHPMGRRALLASDAREYGRSFPDEDLLALDELSDDFQALETDVRAITFSRADNHHLTEEDIAEMEGAGAYLLAAGVECYRLRSEVENADADYGRGGNDNWPKLLQRIPDRVIAFPHFVAENEFAWRLLSQRRYDWTVPGATYTNRQAARRVLRAAGLGVLWEPLLRGTLAACGTIDNYLLKLGIKNFQLDLYRRAPSRAALSLAFRRGIAATRYAYTCGTALEWPIRKYFEIPALGSVLVCTPCAGFENLGFRHGVNALIAEPDELPDLHSWLSSHTEEAQAIAHAGQEFVFGSHSLMARAGQLRDALTSMLNGRFRGSQWIDGEFHINERPAPRDDLMIGRDSA